MDAKTLCLAMLSEGPASGYEIKKAVEDGPVRHFFRLSFGTIYPALGRLHQESLVTVSEESEPGRPDRKLYAITPAGRNHLIAALAAPSMDDRVRSEFLLSLYNVQLLDPAQRARLIDERLSYLDADFDQIAERRQELAGLPLPDGTDALLKFAETIRTAEAEFLRSLKTAWSRQSQSFPDTAR